MSIVRVGTTKKYAEGWELAFGRKKSRATTAAAGSRPAAKVSTKKQSGKAKPTMAKGSKAPPRPKKKGKKKKA